MEADAKIEAVAVFDDLASTNLKDLAQVKDYKITPVLETAKSLLLHAKDLIEEEAKKVTPTYLESITGLGAQVTTEMILTRFLCENISLLSKVIKNLETPDFDV